jgi:hypothetical protein
MPVDAEETLESFDLRFQAGDIFRSASEICDIPIVPEGQTRTGMPGFWASHRLTGDNSRERPYTTIYPRLTTKSNTFTIHYRIQALQQPRVGNYAEWNESRGVILGEYRGSQTVERYIDPNDTTLPDFANPSVTTSLSGFYKYRTTRSKRFSP